MIHVNNLSFAYKDNVPILDDITLAFDKRSTAIIGQNGSGKTTFVKLLKGLLKPTSGNINVLGRNTKQITAAEIATDVGLVFQNPNDQIFKGRVLDEVMFGPLNVRQTAQDARGNSLHALELVGLANCLDANPHDLTLSEKKLLCIASIIAMDTEIVIFDEPTIAQDQAGLRNIKQIIQMLKQQGKLVLTIAHDMDFVAENFERTVVFNQGNVVLDASTREVFANVGILRKAGLQPPFVTQLADKLGYVETILTVDEFIQHTKKSL